MPAGEFKGSKVTGCVLGSPPQHFMDIVCWFSHLQNTASSLAKKKKQKQKEQVQEVLINSQPQNLSTFLGRQEQVTEHKTSQVQQRMKFAMVITCI